jgi:hypothetical protein
VRRLLPALVLLALAPSAHAAAPGVNLVATRCAPSDASGRVLDSTVQTCDVEEAAAAGARSIRLFLEWEKGAADEGYVRKFAARVADAKRLGLRTYLPIMGTRPPADPQAYAAFAGRAAAIIGGGRDVVYEVWNEQDERAFWAGGPDVGRYVAMLRGAYAAIKAADPAATVLFGALTGGNYEYLARAYDLGAKGFFDGVAVHTDTACLVQPPDFYVRNIGQGLDGRINRFSFLSYREVRATMLAAGDDKPIHMTELGWAAFTRRCDQPGFESQPDRLGGVTAAQQAANLTKAFGCLANDPYVVEALWFSLRDFDGRDVSTSKYGLVGRPALQAFREVAAAGGGSAVRCGDFEGPSIASLVPERFGSTLALKARATDETGLARMSFAVGGRVVDTIVASDGLRAGEAAGLDWASARTLPDGPHTVTITAMDLRGNVARLDVGTVKGGLAPVPVASQLQTVRVARGRVAVFRGALRKAFAEAMDGKARITWQARRGGRWKTIHKSDKRLKLGSAASRRTYLFRQRLRFPGAWRARVVYTPAAPYTKMTTRWVRFRAR